MGLRNSTGWASFFWSATTGLGWVKRVNASSSASVPPTKGHHSAGTANQNQGQGPSGPNESLLRRGVLVCFVLLMVCEVPRQWGASGRRPPPKFPQAHVETPFGPSAQMRGATLCCILHVMAQLGAKIEHPSYGEGVIFNQDGDFWRVYFQDHGEKEFDKSFDGMGHRGGRHGRGQRRPLRHHHRGGTGV